MLKELEKYEFTGQTHIHEGRTLRQIRAIRDFGNINIRLVKAGTIGGWIENENNLSHIGNCWVSENARVFDKASVRQDAGVYDNAQVYGNAQVFGNAYIAENARIFENAQVFGESYVGGEAQISGNARVLDRAHVFGEAEVCDFGEVSENAYVANSTRVEMSEKVNETGLGDLKSDIFSETTNAEKEEESEFPFDFFKYAR
ncbi:MAG: hypothetical protein LBG61_01720 [Burkholderiales bacterium]|jgi:NDP-sugar pyrophosphorylase family protein|nr:hypothetical protein [Burkholderiales bacterium]